MSMEEAELGRLTKDHLETHDQVARQKAELEQIGENLVLLGETLKNNLRIFVSEKPKSPLRIAIMKTGLSF